MDIKKHSLNQSFTWHDAEPPFHIINDRQCVSWNESGYFLLENAFDQSELDRLIKAIDPFEKQTNEYLRTMKDKRRFIARADELTFALHMVMQSDVARAFSKHDVFVQLCLDLLGPDCRLYWDQAVYKKPYCSEEFPWHQDNGYNFVTPQDYLTCWVPLVDATIDNGCPWVMPGINQQGTLEHWHTDLGWQCLEGIEDAVPLEAKAGDVIVFSSLTPHRTGPNKTDKERKSYILQYCQEGSVMVAHDDENALNHRPQNHPNRQYPIVVDGEGVS
ncbi:MAG TPA: hypothetical protein DEQ32_11435 [Gammaproteobacteria bacterium]|nr:hypothetical protein [Gammaproteobacteria bacterium]|tara:strand:- start:131 stop:952 length:822 start_codon:yes stop_codon:yes gene_type:complete